MFFLMCRHLLNTHIYLAAWTANTNDKLNMVIVLKLMSEMRLIIK